MANGAFKFKDNSGNVVAYISGSGSDIIISGGTLNLAGMTGLTIGNLTMSGSVPTASYAPNYLLTSSFNTYTGSTNTIIGSLQTSTGSLNSFTSSAGGRLTAIETSTSSLNTYTSSATTRLNSIEGITGSYATTGSNTFNGNLTVTGYIDAQELRTTYISSSILYRSGSTKFGDDLLDTHNFTGSIAISGSLSVPGSNLVSGSSQVDVMSTTNIARLATTGSNTFTSNQIISGSVTTTGNSTVGGYYTFSSWTTGTINKIRGYSGNDDKSIQWNYDNSPAGTVIKDNNSILLSINSGNTLSITSTSTSLSGSLSTTNQITAANGATTGTYGFRHEGAGIWTRMGVPNNSYAYWETNANGGFMIDGALTTTGTATFQGGGNTLTLKKGTGSPAIAFAGTSNEATALLEGVSGGGFRLVNRTGTLSSPTDYQVFNSVNGVATFSYAIKGAAYFDAQASSGFRIRNSADSANVGGFTRRGLWEGNSNYDPGMWAETGYELYYYTNGSATIKMKLSTGGDLSVPQGGLSVNTSVKFGNRTYSGNAVTGNIATNLNPSNTRNYLLICDLNDVAGFSLNGFMNAASYTCWNMSSFYIMKNYSSTTCTAGITGQYKGGGCDMNIVDLSYNSGRYIAIGYTSNPEIDVIWTGYRLLHMLNSDGSAQVIPQSSVTVNSTLATY